MTNAAFDELFGGPPRVPESKLTQREMDLARSVQEVCEEVMLRMARTAHRETGLPNLCLAGGVALNCVGNGRILREGPFKQLWIQPAAGRRRRRAGRRPADLAPPSEAAPRAYARAGRDEGGLPRPGSTRRRDRGLSEARSAPPIERLEREDCSSASRGCSPRRRSSGGSTAGWSSGPAPWARGASWATRAVRGCRRR